MAAHRFPPPAARRQRPSSLALVAGLLLPLLWLTGCLTYRPVIVDSKTQLENDILGSFAQLRREPSLGAPQSLPTKSETERRARQALLDHAFNRLRIAQLKSERVLTERPDGLLATVGREIKLRADIREIETLRDRENEAREVLMKALIELSQSLEAKDLPKLRAFFYRLNTGKARKPQGW
jgi:hypothetical protein